MTPPPKLPRVDPDALDALAVEVWPSLTPAARDEAEDIAAHLEVSLRRYLALLLAGRRGPR
jgi:hypothetical protein